MQRNFLFILAIFIFTLLFFSIPTTTEANSKPTYTITPNSKTFDGNFSNSPSYNKHTKQYFLLRTYLERLEETGGGTLILKKGTYTISNVLSVPSNVTIKLENGVQIVNGMNTGNAQFKPAKSLFQFVRPSLRNTDGAHGAFNGEKNISIIGSGKAVIDLNFVHNGLAIIAAHNQNVRIENIEFINMYSGHFIEIDATKNAIISNNKFMHSKASKNKNKEAINVDTPDRTTLGFGAIWSNFDKTPNVNMLIENNYFYDLDRAIGTHKYSGGSLHDNITIRNNKIEKMRQDPIRVMNWSNTIIENNHIKDVSGTNRRGIFASGAMNPVIQHNVFENMPRAMQFMPWKNNGHGSQYGIIYNKISKANINALQTNTVINTEENFVRINHEYEKFDPSVTDRVAMQVGVFSDFLDGDGGFEETIELVKQGIINGYADNTFKPNQRISRQHVALLLNRALPLEQPINLAHSLEKYRDIDPTHTYAKQIATVTKAGIFSGGNGKFNPRNDITRGQMATVLARAFELENTGEEVKLVDLTSADESHRENIIKLAQNDITIGKPTANGERYFDAEGKLTRVQFVLLLHRALTLNE